MTHEELQHIPEELRELFREYSALGWNPQMCDVLVPYYDNRVPCGMPSSQRICYPLLMSRGFQIPISVTSVLNPR